MNEIKTIGRKMGKAGMRVLGGPGSGNFGHQGGDGDGPGGSSGGGAGAVRSVKKSLVGEDGDVIANDGGYIDVKYKNTDWSPRKQSIVDFVVDEDQRGKGYGKDLVQRAIAKYDDLGGQASSKASVAVLYAAGMRNPAAPDASLSELFTKLAEDSSVYLAMKDDKGIPYVNVPKANALKTLTGPTPDRQTFKQLVSGAVKTFSDDKEEFVLWYMESQDGTPEELFDAAVAYYDKHTAPKANQMKTLGGPGSGNFGHSGGSGDGPGGSSGGGGGAQATPKHSWAPATPKNAAEVIKAGVAAGIKPKEIMEATKEAFPDSKVSNQTVANYKRQFLAKQTTTTETKTVTPKAEEPAADPTPAAKGDAAEVGSGENGSTPRHVRAETIREVFAEKAAKVEKELAPKKSELKQVKEEYDRLYQKHTEERQGLKNEEWHALRKEQRVLEDPLGRKVQQLNEEVRSTEKGLRDEFAQTLTLPQDERISILVDTDADDVKKAGRWANKLNTMIAKGAADPSDYDRRGASVDLEILPGHVRAHYARGNIVMGSTDGLSIFAHEFGHHLEQGQGNRSAAHAFIEEQTGTRYADALRTRNGAVSLNELRKSTHFREDEVALKPLKGKKFIDAYVGKVYKSGHTEVISMGLEKLVSSPATFARDYPEHFDVTVNAMRGHNRRTK